MVPVGIHLIDSVVSILNLSPNEIIAAARSVASEEVVDQVGDLVRDGTRSIVRIAIVIVGALIILRLLRVTVERVTTGILTAQGDPTAAQRQRAETLGRVTESTGRVIIITVAVMMVLTNLGMDIAPLIASAGLAGIAIGLGAQSLVRDMINGFFIIFEDQYGVGDVITVGADTGTVETIDLRRTVLRSINGAQIIIPNGEIRVMQNQSKGWSRAVIDIQTAPTADDTKVVAVLQDVMAGVEDDPQIGQYILEPPQVLGVTEITVTGVTFRILVRTEPLQQWGVERELRLRIREAFRENNIPVPAITTTTLPANEG